MIDINELVIGDRMIYVKDVQRKHQIYTTLKKVIEDGHYGIKIYYKQVINFHFKIENYTMMILV